MCDDLNFPISNLRDRHGVTKVSDSVLDLDLVVEEFLESCEIEDLVADRLRGVDDVLQYMN